MTDIEIKNRPCDICERKSLHRSTTCDPVSKTKIKVAISPIPIISPKTSDKRLPKERPSLLHINIPFQINPIGTNKISKIIKSNSTTKVVVAYSPVKEQTKGMLKQPAIINKNVLR